MVLEKKINIGLSVLNSAMQDIITDYEVYNSEQDVNINITISDLPLSFEGKVKILLLSQDGSTFDYDLDVSSNSFIFPIENKVLAHRGNLAFQIQVTPKDTEAIYTSRYIFIKVIGGILSEATPPDNALDYWDKLQKDLADRIKTLDSYLTKVAKFLDDNNIEH